MKRRQLMQSMGGLMAVATFRPAALAGPAGQETRVAGSDITGRLARYMTAARDRELPPAVVLAATHHGRREFAITRSGHVSSEPAGNIANSLLPWCWPPSTASSTPSAPLCPERGQHHGRR